MIQLKQLIIRKVIMLMNWENHITGAIRKILRWKILAGQWIFLMEIYFSS